jgi:predicted GH43/DUF377 family glycosyl hydrolase
MYHMIFVGFGQEGYQGAQVGHATSSDGVVWTMDPNNPVLTRGEPGEWDDVYAWGGPLIHDGSGFHMWYTGFDGEHERIGHATSPDGSGWTKYEGNPIVDVGPPGSFDDGYVWPWSVIVADGTHRMWYSGVDTTASIYKIGYAESADGISWTKHPDPVLEPGTGWDSETIWTPAVVFDEDESLYHMWYAGNDGQSHTAIGYAWSGDGIEWTKHRDNPVVTAVSRGATNQAVVFDGSTYHMWYTAISATDPSQINYTTSNSGPGVPDLDTWRYIPAAALASGAEGSFYQTDVDVSNADDEAVDYEFSWLPRGENNVEPEISEIFTLEPGRSVRYTNVLAEVFGLEPDAFGALLIKASSPDLLTMSRTYNLGEAGSEGTYGQAMAAIEACDCTGMDVRRRLLFGTEHAEMRFNVGCINVSDRAARVSFELYRSNGTMLGTESMVLMPWSNDQINRIFDPYHPVTGYVDYWSDLPQGSVYCYGSVLDNTTSDPTTIPPL